MLKSNSNVVLEVTFLGDGVYIDCGTLQHIKVAADRILKRIDTKSVHVYGYHDGKTVDYTIEGDFARNGTFDFENA